MSEKKYTYGPDNQERACRVLKVLLDYSDRGIEERKIKCSKTGSRLTFEIDKTDLIALVTAQYPISDWDNDIRPVISHYLEWVGILVDNRTTKRGSPLWKFSLNLWCEDSQKNLQRFKDEWEQKSPERTQKNNTDCSENLSSNTSPQIDWLQISHDLLTHQKNLTTNPLQLGTTRNLDDVHVPLGLMERRERPQVKQEPSPEMGSQLLQPTELTETRRLEHEEFLAEVVGKRTTNNKHIAIIGEPGAGKTTLLTKIGEWLLNPALQSEPAVVVWVSLAAVGSRRLEDYLKQEWLRQVSEGEDLATPWESFKQVRDEGRVWLLLDGLDEMSGDAVQAIQRDLSEAWARNLRVVVTCRLNHWDGVSNSLVNSFEVYRTLDYEYRTATGEDRVLEFLTKWFGNPDTARQIRTSLDDSGKERIKDLVKNPLRLTLFCASWAENQALPETQAELYRRFVNHLYQWKEQEFQAEVNLRQQLDPALGKLATAGLNRQPNRDVAVRRFRFTEPEIAKLWQGLPPTLLPAAKKLGWLAVGKEAGENIYTFLHHTFQEYFAACIIDDWDYFLPRAHVDRPVPCRGETEPTYRVFEKEWQQPILLWIGREDVNDDLKKEFIEKLTNFEELEVEFCYYRAYCIAGICVGEFKSSQQAEDIVKQIITWAFGYWDNDLEKWVTFWHNLQSLAVKIIPLIHRECAIAALVGLLEWKNLDKYHLRDVTRALGEIGIGHPPAIEALLRLLKRNDLDDFSRMDVARALCKIGIGDLVAIEALIGFLERVSLNNYHSLDIARALGKIGIGNLAAIAFLVGLLEQEDLDDFSRMDVARALGEIDVGNQKAIEALVKLLERKDLDDFSRMHVARALGKIEIGNPAAIAFLVGLLEQEDLDDSLRMDVARALGEIDVGNQKAIEALVGLLEQEDLGGLEREHLEGSFLLAVLRVLGQIAVGNQKAIEALVKLLERKNLDDLLICTITEALGEIAVGNQKAIEALVKLLEQKNLDDSLRMDVARALSEIDVGNQKAIEALVRLLEQEDLDDSLRLNVAEALGEIAVGNQKAIEALVRLLERKDLDDFLIYTITEALGEIAVGNQKAIEALVRLLKQKNWNYYSQSCVVETLIAILTKPIMHSVIAQLKNHLTTKVDDPNWVKFQYCQDLIFHCCQILSYPTIHAAWYQNHLPTIPFSLPTLQSQLNHPNTILLDITTLNFHTPNDIPQALTNLIYNQLETRPIPTVTNILQLQTHILNQNLNPHLVLILYHPTPTPTLIQEIAKLHIPQQIQIVWLANASIPDALPPEQPDLATAIQSAIARFSE